jgi:hypothetical protein
MKRIKLILVCGLVLALTGLTTLLVAAGAQREGKALVRTVTGDVTYQADGVGPFLPLRVNMELTPKTVLKSAAGASAYLQVNGYLSTIKLTESTTLTLATMMATGPGLDADTSTDLKLDGGEILGQVKKLSANSDYKVTVPNGVAGVRGTDIGVKVVVGPNGTITVTFTSVTGLLFCQVNAPAGTPQDQASRMLTSGQSWTVTGNLAGVTLTLGTVRPLTPGEIAVFNNTFRPPPPNPPFNVTPTPPPPPTVVPPNTNPSNT